MKKNYFYAMMSAIALTSAIGFTACSSDDGAVADVNPTYDGESVKTQFSISFPENVVSTRMSSSTVQETPTKASFRGMNGIVLIPYSSKTDRTSRLGANITLGNLVKPTTATVTNAIPSGQLLDVSNAVLFNDVIIPVGTSGFLFYGEATATGEDGVAKNFANGYLTPAGLTGESSGISFTPTPITPTPNYTKGNALAAYVSSIAAAAAGSGENDAAWWKCTDETTYGTQTWYSSVLGDLYTKFTSMKAGASSYVQAAVQDLYSTVRNNADAVSTAIKNAILNTQIDSETTYASDAGNTGTLTFATAITGYPGDNNMPEGSVALTWSNVTPKVAATVTKDNWGDAAMPVVKMEEIVYPASLYYFVNSTIKTSNKARISDYNGTDGWSTILGNYSNGEVVEVGTRSVAIEDPIQYAVGRLDVTVKKLDKGNYYDRKGEEVIIPNDGFELTGVLIGGQKAVDYKFNQKTGTGLTEYTIYDNKMNTDGTHKNVVKNDQDAGVNYTLALETATDQVVNVALEFVNNSGQDFHGFDGIVKAGCKFYMVATLNPTENKTDEVTGVTLTGNKVFKQDFKTIANFTIGAGSPDGNHDGQSDTPGGFANAYTTIPDLRTPELELGFSVDLTWQSGITFNVTF